MIGFSLYLIFILLVIITAITPYVTRKTESFGVSVPSDMYNYPQIQRLRKSYLYQSLTIGIFFVVLFLIIETQVKEDVFVLIYSAGIFAYLILTFFVYYKYHKRMKQLKEKENWKEKKKEVVVVDMSFYGKKTTYSNAWFFLPLLITIATALWIFFRYEQIPEQIPMQYNFDGEVVNWVEKSPGTVALFPILQLVLTGLFLFINLVIAKSKQQIDPANPEESVKQSIIFRRRWSLFTIITGTTIVLLFAMPPLSFLFSINPVVFFIITMGWTFLIIFAALILAVTTGQGGSRVKTTNGNKGELINRDDDRFWKLGQFYFNPEDPAVWVEKRFGVGWTVNFARPIAWITFILIIAIPLFLAIMLT